MINIDSLWKTHVRERYAKLERNRSYALPNDAKRFLCWLWVACERLDRENPGKLFESSLEQFADAGINCLQPRPPNELKAPEAWRDPWNNPLPNPYATGDLQGQSLLAKRDPVLNEWFKKFAKSPYAAASEWADKQAAILKQRTAVYDSDTHTANVFANGTTNQTDIAAFHRNAPAEVIARCKWEAKPVTFPTAGKDFDLTQVSKISTIPHLSALWNAMNEQEREYVAHERVTLRQQQSEAAARLKALEAASGTPEPPRMAARARVGAE
jgi:hypothetical protein